MHRLLLVLAVLLWTSDILRAQQRETHVLVRQPLVVLIPSFKLPAVCGTNADNLQACTAFVAERLGCQCERRDSGWRMVVSAQFIPVMYVLGPDYVSHERDHIKDIEQSLRKYLIEEQSIQFDSVEACEREATVQSANFAKTMNRFKEDSQVARHRGYQRRVSN